MFLQVNNISKQLQGNPVVKGVSFEQQQGQKLGIIGETGSGKSSLLKMIAGLMQPDAGHVYFNGKRIKGPDEKLIPGHAGVAYLSQHYELRNSFRMEELLSYANTLTEAEANALYDICHIGHLMKRKNDQISGGENQRIALARLLVTAPQLLLLDEPYSNLDLLHKQTLKQVVANIGQRLGTTCLMVSHDPQDMLAWADTIMVLQNGSIVQSDTPEGLYQRPVSLYVAGLLGRYNLLPAKVAAALHVNVPAGQSLFIRPEDFIIADSGLAVTVEHVAFNGNFYELAVNADGMQLYVHTMQKNIATGDHFFLQANSTEPVFF
jgi:ABC-type sugar transport system ATPase subunit